MTQYVIGNWKCHKTSEIGKKWLDTFALHYRPARGLEVSIAPTLLSLELLADYGRSLKLDNFTMTAQDISPFPPGSYTGAVAADMVKGFAKYVIVGHSERRRYFHETGQDIINKVAEAADAGLAPVVCVEDANFLSQLSPITDLECEQLIIAYTPVDAVNFRIAESPDRVGEMVARIRQYFSTWPIIYGGSVTIENVVGYLGVDGIDGVFVGGASLDAESFAEICNCIGAI